MELNIFLLLTIVIITFLLTLSMCTMYLIFSKKIKNAKTGEMASKKIIDLQEIQATLEKKEQELLANNQLLEKQKLAMLNVLEDVNIEKELSAKQALDLQKFQLAVDNVSDHIVITDIDGIVLYANPAATRITGFENKEMVGQKVGTLKLWGGRMSKEIYTNMWKVIKSDKRNFSGEFTNHRKNGQEYIVETHISPILDKEGNIQFFVGIERDVTKAKEVDRMKTDFISLASHQLRTPLSAMKWFLEMLGGGDMGKLTQEQADAINNINLSNERMIMLVNSLLNISRIESGRIAIDPEPTDIMSLIKDVEQEITSKLIEKNQTLIIDEHDKIPLINLDPKMLRQVLVNLLTNAIKYSMPNGKIVIKATIDQVDATLSVADSGYGIPTKEQENIFHRFFRASNIVNKETDGTGLGLYLCKEIAQSMEGKIWFTSKENEGTTFFFSFPLKGIKPKKGEVELS